jgi:hypothetical protein
MVSLAIIEADSNTWLKAKQTTGELMSPVVCTVIFRYRSYAVHNHQFSAKACYEE